MSGIQDYMTYQINVGIKGKATKKEISDTLAKDEDKKQHVEEKLLAMNRFGLISIEGNVLTPEKK